MTTISVELFDENQLIAPNKRKIKFKQRNVSFADFKRVSLSKFHLPIDQHVAFEYLDSNDDLYHCEDTEDLQIFIDDGNEIMILRVKRQIQRVIRKRRSNDIRSPNYVHSPKFAHS